jgi:hypothetical protein
MTETTNTASRTARSWRMRVAAAALAVAATVGSGIATATAADAAPKCKTISVAEAPEYRVTMSGVMQVRTVTTTKQRCRGKVSSIVTYSAWRTR